MSKGPIRPRVCFLPVAGKDCPHQFLTMKGLAESGRFEVRHGVDARFFPCLRTWWQYRPDWFYFDWIERYYIGRNPVVTLVKMITFYLDVLLTTKILRRPIYWTVHNLHSHERMISGRWELFMQRFFARHATRIRVFSQGSMRRVSTGLGVAPAKLFVLPEGNYVGYYKNGITRAEARTNLKLPADDFVLLWLGNIRPYKGLPELIETFQKAAKANWRLVIAGKPYIEAYAVEVTNLVRGDGRIDFRPGFVAEDDLQTFYNAADAVVLPFTDIENSASLTMSMGFGKPVVAPNLGVVGERLRRQPELVYAPGGLAEAFKTLAALPPTRLVEIGRANLEEVAKYKWEDIATLFETNGEK